MKPLTVLTGDIIGSSSHSSDELNSAMQVIESASQSLIGWDGVQEVHFARRGGDGWQVAHDAPALACRSALYLQAALRCLPEPFETRIAIATGAGQIPDRDGLNAAHGPAFTASGRLLDQIDRHAHMAHAAGGATAAALRLADHIAQGWTQAQARALVAMLPPNPGPRSAAAERLGITRQAVDQALWAAGYPALMEALALLEAAT